VPGLRDEEQLATACANKLKSVRSSTSGNFSDLTYQELRMFTRLEATNSPSQAH
jgi:hypothetical protein